MHVEPDDDEAGEPNENPTQPGPAPVHAAAQSTGFIAPSTVFPPGKRPPVTGET